ncbi:helix-turn-helix domain-containing protein [Rhizobium sp. CSW-27]|uniref:helix-turn-helix domain-containing protein n=1 Tax=Rhizobium sp. CSW-27 TaxID=2839985 RepID=UPI001C0346F2|nr:helix-turn-helix domain-containing protein [Rhizobium sp. CSW-27]MBT9371632.1 helix-turn-helix domain-containing protein [Rhizobium sp. CSW-27]
MNLQPLHIQDESVPVHPDHDPRHPLVIFGDHRFCAGAQLEVQKMAGPHMHSQIELNFVLSGRMTYWFDGRELTVGENRLCLFWGMIPHQVIDRAEGTRFVCLYVPMSVFLGFASLSRFRDAVFRGAVIEALDIRSWDRDVFLRWRDELLSGDAEVMEIVRSELTARVMRIEREGWRDLREQAAAIPTSGQRDADWVLHVENMLRFIGEGALSDISAEDVGRAAGLHPNYAMTLFRKAVGMTINQAIIRHRLDTAQSLLIATDLPITEVAYESGFGSLSTFYEAFQRRFKEKPVQYRRRMRPSLAAAG